MKFQAVRGTRDILSPLVEEFVALEAVAREQARLWGFGEIRMPSFEDMGLFAKSVGETSDIVEHEMYTLTDRGGRTLALRPEGTAGAVRAYIENNFPQNNPEARLFYIGNMYRAERPQAGRYREFEQIGFEHFGDPSAVADAGLIQLAEAILKGFGVREMKLSINSIGCEDAACRPAYREALKTQLRKILPQLCENCQRRLERNPLRCLDCKKCGALVAGVKPEFAKCAACRDHETLLLKTLEAGGLDFTLDPSIVRGLDYYTRTVFEFTSGALGAQNAICGGGRYDRLVDLLGGPPTPAAGFAIGVDRTIEARRAGGHAPAASLNACVYLVLAPSPAGMQNTINFAVGLAQKLRNAGIAVLGGSPSKSLKSQMRQAGKSMAGLALIIGEEEARHGQGVIKNLKSGEEAKVPAGELASYITQNC